MYGAFKEQLTATLQEIKSAGLYKSERQLTSPQSAHITTAKVAAVNFCANNYLGLANHPTVVAAASKALQEWGFGMASVRFICGTQTLHAELEAKLSAFLGTEATILYSSCFDANGGVFETLFGEQDAIISDELNHASLIDGIRLSKSRRLRYKNADMADLKSQLISAAGARRRVIVTDGVFSMDGSFAPLDKICDLAEEYDALVMVDDSHAVGFVGDVTARCATQGLAQRAREDVDTVDDVEELRGPAAAVADKSHGMGVVHHDQRVILLGEIADLVQRCEGPIHGEHSVGDDHPPARTSRRDQLGLEIGHIRVLVAKPPGLGQADPVNERGVVELVGDDRVLLAEQCLEDATVGVKT